MRKKFTSRYQAQKAKTHITMMTTLTLGNHNKSSNYQRQLRN